MLRTRIRLPAASSAANPITDNVSPTLMRLAHAPTSSPDCPPPIYPLMWTRASPDPSLMIIFPACVSIDFTTPCADTNNPSYFSNILSAVDSFVGSTKLIDSSMISTSVNSWTSPNCVSPS